MLEDKLKKIAMDEIQHFKCKADHNKMESMFFFISALLGTLLTPIFFTMGETTLLSKVIPSLLSALSAFSISWLQLRRPQQLWALYRGCQRDIENLILKHEYDIEPFNSKKNEKDEIFISKLIEIKTSSHKSWAKLTPSPDSISSTKNSD